MNTPSSLPTLNIGILAHVDAGKTSLTERLLFDFGATDRLGSVDAGNTRTDSGSVERRRGITVRTAVAPLTAHGVQINLIDTPGHADFIAEVERALGVLDAAGLVLSAVEGVQAQTRVLMRSLRRLNLPTLIFVNKTDRPGARTAALLADIRRTLTPYAAAMTEVEGAGSPSARTVVSPMDDPAHGERLAEVLAENDDTVLNRLVEESLPPAGELRRLAAAAIARSVLHPVYFGSSVSGAGIAELVDGIVHYAPRPPAEPSGLAEPQGVVFAVEQGSSTARTAYLRLYEGTLVARQRVTLHRCEPDGTRSEHPGRITALDVIGRTGPLTAGNIARVRGLRGVRVGDRLGTDGRPAGTETHFTAPTLETVVRPRDARQTEQLHAALLELADQDPLLRTRTVSDGGTSVLLYGEVQKEIIADTLAEDYGILVDFESSRAVCVTRPVGVGEAVEEMGHRAPGESGFFATIGLRVEPGTPGSGVVFAYETELGALPYAFHRAIDETVRESLKAGPHGWEITDCRVTLTRSGLEGSVSTAADFRGLTPIVLAHALKHAGTQLYEPYHAFEAEVPLSTLATVGARLAALGAKIRETASERETGLLAGEIPARDVHRAQQALPSLSHGEGTWWSRPSGYHPT